MSKIVYPNITGWIGGMGPHPVFLNASEPWDGDDPLVQENPERFSDEPSFPLRRSVPAAEAPVETATAAPGEKRTTRRPKADNA